MAIHFLCRLIARDHDHAEQALFHYNGSAAAGAPTRA
jgi:hypothetical protein